MKTLYLQRRPGAVVRGAGGQAGEHAKGRTGFKDGEEVCTMVKLDEVDKIPLVT